MKKKEKNKRELLWFCVRAEKIPVTWRLCRVGLRREERSRSGRDEQQLSDILFVPPRPPLCITIHSLCESRLDLTALQLCMDVCAFLCMRAHMYVLQCLYMKQMGGDGNEESRTEEQRPDREIYG